MGVMELKDFKVEFKKIAKKHKIPSFDELNECFEIDRIERDTDFLLREVRKTMMEKVVSYIRFLEMMLNPAQAPPMFLMFIKTLKEEDVKNLQKVYEKFIEVELLALRLEVDYSEDGEAKSIQKIFDMWNLQKKDLGKILDVMERNWKSVGTEKKERGYFG